MPFWLLLAFNNVFLCVLLNTDQNNICVATVFQARTKQKYEEFFFTVFNKKLKNAFFGGQPIFFPNFFSMLPFKTIDTQMLF